MQSINQNKLREGSFTSSDIASIMTNGKVKNTFGAPALTYIEECNMERRLRRSLDRDVTAKPLSWGKMCERIAFDLLESLDYKLSSDETLPHPTIHHWCGSPDGNKFDEGKTVFDIKCPITLKSFCQFMDCKGNIEVIRNNHKDGEKYYWQLVSNAIITGSKFAELILYVPYRSELQKLRDYAINSDNPTFNWIIKADDYELPFLNDGGYYKNINVIRWEVSEADKKLLTDRVTEAGKMLVPYYMTEEK